VVAERAEDIRLREFVSQHADAIYAYVRHWLAPRQDLVEDTVQDVFLAAFEGLAHFRSSSSLRAWLLGLPATRLRTSIAASCAPPARWVNSTGDRTEDEHSNQTNGV
jgi:hypothetical protein